MIKGVNIHIFITFPETTSLSFVVLLLMISLEKSKLNLTSRSSMIWFPYSKRFTTIKRLKLRITRLRDGVKKDLVRDHMLHSMWVLQKLIVTGCERALMIDYGWWENIVILSILGQHMVPSRQEYGLERIY